MPRKVAESRKSKALTQKKWEGKNILLQDPFRLVKALFIKEKSGSLKIPKREDHLKMTHNVSHRLELQGGKYHQTCQHCLSRNTRWMTVPRGVAKLRNQRRRQEQLHLQDPMEFHISCIKIPQTSCVSYGDKWRWHGTDRPSQKLGRKWKEDPFTSYSLT